jgi:hypothetical protein
VLIERTPLVGTIDQSLSCAHISSSPGRRWDGCPIETGFAAILLASDREARRPRRLL